MGTCYSKSGHELDTSNPDKRPKERKKGSQKNGHIDSNHKPKLIIEDFDIIQKDVSDTVYTEDSHTNGLDVDNLLHKSQQTSLDMLAKDTNRNTETVTVDDSNETSDMKDACSSKEVILDCEYESQVTEHNKEKLEDKVVGSDSGVVLENTVEPETRTEVSCKNLVKPPTTLSSEKTVEQDSESKVESTSAETQPHSDKVQNSFSDINSGVNNSKPQAKSVTEHSSYTCYHGECQGHLFIETSVAELSNIDGSSEALPLKSSLKKGKRKPRQKKGLSWKSADSLDYVETMATSLDRTKSVCSSILGDDISLFNAPLATFDSVEYAIGNSYDFSKLCDSASKTRELGCDIFQFKYSGLAQNNVRQSVGSIDRLSDSYRNSDSYNYTDFYNLNDSTSDLDKLKLAVRQSNSSMPADQWSLSDSLDTSYDLSSVHSQPIRTMNMNGRDVVVIDQELFSQIIDEIQFLKMKLSQLTEVIQETDAPENNVTEGTSFLSSSA